MDHWVFPSAERRAELRAQGVVPMSALSVSFAASIAVCVGLLFSTGEAGRLFGAFSALMVSPAEQLPEQLANLGRIVLRLVAGWSCLVIAVVFVTGIVAQRGFFMLSRAMPNIARLWPERWLLGLGERLFGACGMLAGAICLAGVVVAGSVFTLSRWLVLPRGSLFTSAASGVRYLLLVLLVSSFVAGVVAWSWERLVFLWRHRVPRELRNPHSEE